MQRAVMRHFQKLGYFDKADALRETLNAEGPASAAAHWNATFLGQLMNEPKIAGVASGPGQLNLPEMGIGALADLVKAQPQSSTLAITYLTRHFQQPSQPPADSAPADPIPRHIIQYWNTPDLPPEVARIMQSWQTVPGYTHRRFSRAEALTFLRTECGPRWTQALHMAGRPAEEADFFRLSYLARHGGIWADADDMLIGDLDALLAGPGDLVLCREPIGGTIENNFIAVRPGHPVIMAAARQARQALLRRSSETIWAKTGPGLLSRVVARFMAQSGDTAQAAALRVLEFRDIARHIVMQTDLPYKSSSRHWHHRAASPFDYPGLLAAYAAPRS
jgi:mannosyltransferase OCH1-like enzyme